MALSEKQAHLPLYLMSEDFCTTIPRIKTISYTWALENVSSLSAKSGAYLSSSVFPKGNHTKHKLFLQIYPHGTVHNTEAVYVSLKVLETGKDGWNGKFVISILDSKLMKRKMFSQAFPDEFGTKFMDCGTSVLIQRQELVKNADLLPNDKLTICCEISIYGEPINLHYQRDPECQLACDLGNLFQNPKFSDATVVVYKSKFQVHKAILAARSPVFAAMFEHDMKEKDLNCVDIVDFQPDVVEQMLKYIYSGKVDELQNVSVDLLVAAEKYELPRLKVICENRLMKDLSIENVITVFIVADLCRSHKLKYQALSYITANAADIVETESWTKLLKNHSHLVTEIFKAIANGKVSTLH